jgi:hypothetical protein
MMLLNGSGLVLTPIRTPVLIRWVTRAVPPPTAAAAACGSVGVPGEQHSDSASHDRPDDGVHDVGGRVQVRDLVGDELDAE